MLILVPKTVLRVKQRILQDLASKKISTSWYHRPMTVPSSKGQSSKVLVPHPGNVSNAKQLTEYQACLERCAFLCELIRSQIFNARPYRRLTEEERVWEKLVTDRQSAHSASLQNLQDMQSTLESNPESLLITEEESNESGKTTVDVTQLSAWIGKALEDVTLDVHHLESVLARAQGLESQTRSSCESLFAMLLKAFGDREKTTGKTVDPASMLKLLSVSQSGAL